MTEAKKALGQAFTNPASIKKTIDTAMALKEGGAKALLPMLQQGLEAQLTNQIASFVPKALGQSPLGQGISNGVQGIVANQAQDKVANINPLRQQSQSNLGQSSNILNNSPTNAMKLTFK